MKISILVEYNYKIFSTLFGQNSNVTSNRILTSPSSLQLASLLNIVAETRNKTLVWILSCVAACVSAVCKS